MNAFYLTKNINVFLDKNISDKHLENYVETTLKIKNLNKANKYDDKNTSLHIIANNDKSPETASILHKYKKYVTVNFNKIDAYSLIIKDNKIVLIVKDKAAAFSALSTVQWILEELKNSALREVIVNDYADTKIRGFIEGFYGVPWTWKGRQSLIKMSSKYKTNSYIFAPKDDPYHAEKWDETYPNESLANIKKTVDIGHDNGVEFTWTMHPWINKNNVIDLSNDFNNELIKAKAKFQQLYDIGIRQFGIQADDVGGQPVNLIAKMMHELVKWGKSEGRKVKLWTFCQPKYEGTWLSWSGSFLDLRKYQDQLPKDDLFMFYTGTSVLAPVSKYSTEWFKNNSDAKRSSLFWLNWPVNDPDYTAINLGPGTMLESDVQADSLSGVVTNPMQEFELSKISISSISSYSWNIKGYEPWKVWENAFKKIEPDAHEELKQLAKHITSTKNPDGGYWGVNIDDESKDIREEIEVLKNNIYYSELLNSHAFKKISQDMIKTKQAYVNLMSKSKNDQLKSEIKLFGLSLSQLSESIDLALKAYQAKKEADQINTNNKLKEAKMSEAKFYASKALDLFNLSQKVERFDLLEGSKPLNQRKFVKPGRDYLIPFAKILKEAILEFGSETKLAQNSFKESGIVNTGNLTSSFSEFYNDKKLNLATDNDTKTATWSNKSASSEDFYQLNFDSATNITQIKLFTGSEHKQDSNWFKKAKIIYTSDNKNWIDVPNGIVDRLDSGINNNRILKTNLYNVKALKVVPWENDANKIALREFSINGRLTDSFDVNLFENKNINQGLYYNGENKEKLGAFVNKNNLFTYVATKENPNISLSKNQYIGLKLNHISLLKNVEFLATGNKDKLKVQISENEVNWTDLNNTDTAKNKLAKYIRVTNETEAKIEFKISKFVIELENSDNQIITSSNKNDQINYEKLTNNSTPFISDSKQGWIEYKSTSLIEAEQNRLIFVQDPNKISNALVSAQVYNKTTKKTRQVNLGYLDKIYNIFKLKKEDDLLLSWKITYENDQLTLVQVIKEKDNSPVNIEKLKKLSDSLMTIDTLKIEKDKLKRIQELKQRATQLLKEDIGDQSEVDNILWELEFLSVNLK
ncbi:beta-N-acetylglucosaminidase domain-containing protein [Mycoplasmopsis alligatoris]|uniref:F5/8 type C domain protein n=1 Tax=Mycoplasmopsis alligatoris A21JP2 TaxID=747682 RepID=D4XVB4_9BACT|nr:beta-N-acetylglucosaminidase domain-containing protein [Mycoplasmopsis alligatoris]EFF41651.1 F5/8 type C domain protein [Mycoplasmopsis alligatoris A21JP2]